MKSRRCMFDPKLRRWHLSDSNTFFDRGENRHREHFRWARQCRRWVKSGVSGLARHVRFTLRCRHRQPAPACPFGAMNGLVGSYSIILALLQEVFKAACASVRAAGSFPPRSRLHSGRYDLDGDNGEEIGAAPVARADEIALGRGLLREVGATAPPRDIGQEAALGQPILVYLDLLLTQPLGISLKAAFDLRFGLADLALDVIRLLVFPLGEVLFDDLHRALAS